MKTTKILSLLAISVITFHGVQAATDVTTDVNNIRASGNVGTFGSIISKIFNISGEIQGKYLELDEDIDDLSTHDEVPSSKAVKDLFDSGLDTLWTANGANKIYYNSGSVGIGTNNPSARLSVNEITSTYTIPKFSVGRNEDEAFKMYVGDNDGILSYEQDETTATSHDFRFNIKSASPVNSEYNFQFNGATKMTLSENGNVNIKSTGDAELGSTNHGLTIGNPAGGNIAIDNNEILARNNGASATLYIQGSSSISNTLINVNGGNVGIGTTDPQSNLDLGSATAGRNLSFAKYVNFGSEYSTANLILGRMVKPKIGTAGLQYSLSATTTPSVLALTSSGDFKFSTQPNGAIVKGATFDLNSNAKFTVKNNGNVGIGTTNPSQKLDVKGTDPAILVGTTSLTKGVLHFGNPNHGIGRGLGNTHGNDLTMYTGGSGGFNFALTTSPYGKPNMSDVKMKLSSAGNLGIGTTSPSDAKLVINSAAGSRGLQLETEATGGPNTPAIRFKDGNGSITAIRQSAGDLTLGTGWYNERIRIKASNGNVGIGTTNPSTKLDIKGNVRINTGSSHSSLNIGQQVHDNIFADNSAAKYYGGGMWFRVNKATTGYTDSLRLAENGNIGISINPTEKLHVSGNSLVTGRTYIGSTDTYFYRQTANTIATPDNFYVQNSSASTYLYSTNTYLGDNAGTDTIRLRGNTFLWNDGVIESGGKVGIGTQHPSAKLTIAGNIGRTAHNNGALVGGYNNLGTNRAKTNPIYSIGSNYLPANATLANHYGVGYTHTDASFISTPGAAGRGMYVSGDGDARHFLNGSSGTYWNTGGMFVDGSRVIGADAWLEGDRIRQNSIDSSEIQNNTITADDLAPNSVGNSELVDDITINYARGLNDIHGDFGNIARSTDEWLRLNDGNSHTNGIYTGLKMRADGGFQVDNIWMISADGWLEGDRIRQNTIDSSEIQNNTITSTDILNNTITASDLAPNSVGNSELIASPAFTNPTVSAPTAATHVANKAYVDSQVSAAGGGGLCGGFRSGYDPWYQTHWGTFYDYSTNLKGCAIGATVAWRQSHCNISGRGGAPVALFYLCWN